MSNDIALGPVGLPQIGNIYKKPPHLITLSKGKLEQFFISLDKPELLIGFIQVKGFYTAQDLDNTDLYKLISDTKKEDIKELMLPQHRVLEIKNLAFKAK